MSRLKEIASLPDDLTAAQIEDVLSYRRAMAVNAIYVYRSGLGFSVCPRCKRTLEREYVSFCDRCGQMLSWKEYSKAMRIHIE